MITRLSKINLFIHSNYINTKPTVIEHKIPSSNETNIAMLTFLNYKKEFVVCFRTTDMNFNNKSTKFIDLTYGYHKYKSFKNNNLIPKINNEIYKIFCHFKFQLYSLVNSNKAKEKILLCGYGIGGAVSQIASVFLSSYIPTCKINCITFGSPACGDQLFANLYNQSINKSFRIIVAHDKLINKYHKKFIHVEKPIIILDKKLEINNSIRKKHRKSHKYEFSLNKYVQLLTEIAHSKLYSQ